MAFACALDILSPCDGGWYIIDELWKRAFFSFLKSKNRKFTRYKELTKKAFTPTMLHDCIKTIKP